MADFATGLFSVFGVLVGVALGEWFRRSRRIESYASHIFDKRLSAYDELMRKLNAAAEVATDVMKNPNYSAEERHSLISGAILDLATFADENELYIDPDLSVHCMATFMGAEDVYEIKDESEKREMERLILDNHKNARRMIREDSGVVEIEKHFRKVAKPRLTSAVIERIRYLRAHPEELRD